MIRNSSNKDVARRETDMAGTKTISIVCPAYQEEEVLPLFHAVLVEALESLADVYQLEIIYVDDGSRDGTLEVIKELATTDPRVQFVSLSRNFGHQAALTAGLEHASGDAVVSLDSDLQHPPRLIPELVARWRAGFDIVLTVRADDTRLRWFKRFSSRLVYRVLARCSTLDVRPAASDFRLMSRRAVKSLLQLRESHRYLRGMVQWLGFRVAEVPFEPNARLAGTSKYSLGRMVRFAMDGLLSFSPVPLRIAVGGGLGITALSWVASLALILGVVPIAEPVCKVALIGLTALHLIAASVFVGIGVLGEYVYRIYEQVKERPVYLVNEATTLAAVRKSARSKTTHRHATKAA